MDNLHIYNQYSAVPKEALKEIKGGRMSGKSDINPMFRIRALTEMFGPCGIGWRYVITKQWLEPGANSEVAAFVNIDLHYKYDGVWSEAVPGNGGNMFVTKEKNGLYTSDEAFKMAQTDAISVACKALGIGADVYWAEGKSKYTNGLADDDKMNQAAWAQFWLGLKDAGWTQEQVHTHAGEKSIAHYTRAQAAKLYGDLKNKKPEEKKSA